MNYQTRKLIGSAIAESIFQDVCKEEQRLVREYNRLVERIQQNQRDKYKYGKIIGVFR